MFTSLRRRPNYEKHENYKVLHFYISICSLNKCPQRFTQSIVLGHCIMSYNSLSMTDRKSEICSARTEIVSLFEPLEQPTQRRQYFFPDPYSAKPHLSALGLANSSRSDRLTICHYELLANPRAGRRRSAAGQLSRKTGVKNKPQTTEWNDSAASCLNQLRSLGTNSFFHKLYFQLLLFGKLC